MKLAKKILLLLIAASSAMVISCKKDTTTTPGNPVVTVVPTSQAVKIGDMVSITITASSDPARTLKRMLIQEITSNPQATHTLLDSSLSTGNIGYTYKYAVTGNPGARTIVVTFTDNKGSTGAASVSLMVNSGIASYSAIMLAAPLKDGSSKSFFSASNGNTYTFDDAASNSRMIDFGYIYTSNAKLVAPSDGEWHADQIYDGSGPGSRDIANWATKNATKFSVSSLSSADFDNANAPIILAAAAVTDTVGITKVENLNTTNKTKIIAFTTADGHPGLIRVAGIKEGFGSGDYIKIDVKVLQQ